MTKSTDFCYGASEDAEAMTALVGGYVPVSAGSAGGGQSKPITSDFTLIFDTETTLDPGQALRFGTYQFRHKAKIIDQGIFFDPNAVSAEKLSLLRKVAAEQDVSLLTRDQFVEDVLYDKACELNASSVGFDFRFDISRLAIRHASTSGKVMKGGFTLQLSKDPWKPRIQVRHLNNHTSLIQFAGRRWQMTPRGQRKRRFAGPSQPIG